MDPRSLSPRLGALPDATARVAVIATRGPLSRAAARLLVAGDTVDDAARVTGELTGSGQRVSWMPLLRPATSPDDILTARGVIAAAMERLAGTGSKAPDLTLDLGAFGVLADDVTPGILLASLRELGQAARNSGVSLTLTIVEAAFIEAVYMIGHELRQDFPEVGIVLPTRLRRAPGDLDDLAKPGQRVRLTTGRLDAAIGTTSARDSGNAFVEITKRLIAEGAQVGFETDDALLLDIAGSLVQRHGVDAEVVAPLGAQSAKQRETPGLAPRVVVPYGPHWSSYLTHLATARPGLALSLTNPVRRKA